MSTHFFTNKFLPKLHSETKWHDTMMERFLSWGENTRGGARPVMSRTEVEAGSTKRVRGEFDSNIEWYWFSHSVSDTQLNFFICQSVKLSSVKFPLETKAHRILCLLWLSQLPDSISLRLQCDLTIVLHQ